MIASLRLMRCGALAALIGLGSFAGAPAAQASDFGFGSRPKLFVLSKPVVIVDETRAPAEGPLSSDVAPIGPRDVVKIWVRERLSVRPGDAQLTMRIREAAVEREPLAPTGGGDASTGSGSGERLTAVLAVEMDYLSGKGWNRAIARATASREVPAGAVASERERIHGELIEQLARAFDRTMSAEADRMMQAMRNG